MDELKSSIAVTTYAGQTYYTSACLESIAKWKTDRHELIVACHDPSLLMEEYLNAKKRDGLIDKLIWTPSNHGHTKGVDECFRQASNDLLFNVANDILVGPYLVDDCSYRLKWNPLLGIVGWHWYSAGAYWENGKIVHRLRDESNPFMHERDRHNIEQAPWFTGKAFEGLGGSKWVQLCNTAFFGIRRNVWEKVGGMGNGPYRHYWADDFLSYSVLDQGLDVREFDPRFKRKPFFHEFQYDNVDVEHRHRGLDYAPIPTEADAYFQVMEGGLSKEERSLLWYLARNIEDHSRVLHVGLWRGTGLMIFMQQMRAGYFIGIDCFDMPGISGMSAQSPVSMGEVKKNLAPFTKPTHVVELIKGNTLEMESFPSADVIFIDAGHTKECIANDVRLAKAAIRPGGMIIFHDYGQPSWADVKVVIDESFAPEQIRSYHTICVVRA